MNTVTHFSYGDVWMNVDSSCEVVVTGIDQVEWKKFRQCPKSLNVGRLS